MTSMSRARSNHNLVSGRMSIEYAYKNSIVAILLIIIASSLSIVGVDYGTSMAAKIIESKTADLINDEQLQLNESVKSNINNLNNEISAIDNRINDLRAKIDRINFDSSQKYKIHNLIDFIVVNTPKSMAIILIEDKNTLLFGETSEKNTDGSVAELRYNADIGGNQIVLRGYCTDDIALAKYLEEVTNSGVIVSYEIQTVERVPIGTDKVYMFNIELNPAY